MPSQNYFNKLFSLYAPFYPIVSKLFIKSRINQIGKINKLLESKRHARVLLIGAGDGIDIPLFNPNIHLTYLDASSKMYKKAVRKHYKRGNIQFELTDFLDFNPNIKYDAICCHFCLSVTAHAAEMINRSCMLMKESGVFSIMDIEHVNESGIRKAINGITKYSMFDMQLNVLDIMNKSAPDYKLIDKRKLQETGLFSSLLFAISK